LAEIVFPQAVIPTTSLFLIEELVGDKLDGYIYELQANSATESLKPKEEMPYKWATLRIYQTPHLIINYSLRKCGEEVFSLPITVELARKYEIGECWIDRLVLHIIDRKMGDCLYIFKNKPITKGTDAERFVFNFYRRRKTTGWIKNAPRRHLPLVSTRVLTEKRAHLDELVIHSPEFIWWLNRMTHGLVYHKQVKRTAGDRFIDVSILEAGA
jgi:hypothetical protein